MSSTEQLKFQASKEKSIFAFFLFMFPLVMFASITFSVISDTLYRPGKVMSDFLLNGLVLSILFAIMLICIHWMVITFYYIFSKQPSVLIDNIGIKINTAPWKRGLLRWEEIEEIDWYTVLVGGRGDYHQALTIDVFLKDNFNITIFNNFFFRFLSIFSGEIYKDKIVDYLNLKTRVRYIKSF